jgi:hypothetical protein
MGYSTSELERVSRAIEGGAAVGDSELVPFLTLGSKEERGRVNLRLARAFRRRHELLSDASALRRAGACAGRALLLSRYSAEALPLFVEINRALKDVAALKEALKRVGIESAARGDFDAALGLFDRWAYADFEFAHTDTHGYDPDILACVERMAALRRPERPAPAGAAQGRRVRLAYLTQGLTEAGSVLIKIDKVFARLHDKSRFEVAYFTTEGEAAVAASPDALSAVEEIRASGCLVFVPPDCATVYERLLSVGGRMRDFAPDVLVACGGLVNFRNYFVTCLKPAPVTVALNQGPPQQFSWHDFDHSVCWNRALITDCPADCTHVPLELELPPPSAVRPAGRSELGVPEGATLLASGGRSHKFQDPAFWRGVSEVLGGREDFYWLFAGFTEEQVPALAGSLSPEARGRVRFLGWRGDYLNCIAAADLFVDSYPLGGGALVAEVMSLGLAALSFEHDYVSVFDNGEGSGGDEIVGVPELLIPRGDFGRLRARVSELSADPERRRRLGETCRERARRGLGDPARMVRRCEDVYERVLSERGGGRESEAAGRDGRGGVKSPAGAEDAGLGDYRLMLVEREDALNRREAELRRREAGLLPRLARGLRRRWPGSRGR